MRKWSRSSDGLRAKYPCASKAFKVEVIPAPAKDKATIAKDIVWKRRDAYENEDKLDGCYRLRRHTGHRSWSSIRDILSTHQRLTMEYREKTNHGHPRVRS